jgi:hypothetical protein
VPGHAGVRGNQAGRLAGIATVKSDQIMDQVDILNALREAGRGNNSSDKGETATLTRLQELHVKQGTARYEFYAESQRRLVNQHRAGVVSRYTLRDILKM